MADPLLLISIALEIGVFSLLALSVWRGKGALLGLALAFLIYVFYDSSRALSLYVPDSVLSLVFMLASWAALWSAWQIFSQKG